MYDELLARADIVLGLEYDYARHVSAGALPQWADVMLDLKNALEHEVNG